MWKYFVNQRAMQEHQASVEALCKLAQDTNSNFPLDTRLPVFPKKACVFSSKGFGRAHRLPRLQSKRLCQDKCNLIFLRNLKAQTGGSSLLMYPKWCFFLRFPASEGRNFPMMDGADLSPFMLGSTIREERVFITSSFWPTETHPGGWLPTEQMAPLTSNRGDHVAHKPGLPTANLKPGQSISFIAVDQ